MQYTQGQKVLVDTGTEQIEAVVNKAERLTPSDPDDEHVVAMYRVHLRPKDPRTDTWILFWERQNGVVFCGRNWKLTTNE